MGQILHGSATTTAGVRRAIQNSQASIRTLAKQYSINPKTVAKWKKRSTVHDADMGPKQRHSTILTTEEETLIVAFRKLTLLPLDDCLYALQETIPHLTRSALHRCFQRYEINRLPQITEKASKKKRFKSYPIGYFTSTSLRYRRKKASFTCLWPLIVLRSLPLLRYISRRPVLSQPNSCAIFSILFPIKFTPF